MTKQGAVTFNSLPSSLDSLLPRLEGSFSQESWSSSCITRVVISLSWRCLFSRMKWSFSPFGWEVRMRSLDEKFGWEKRGKNCWSVEFFSFLSFIFHTSLFFFSSFSCLWSSNCSLLNPSASWRRCNVCLSHEQEWQSDDLACHDTQINESTREMRAWEAAQQESSRQTEVPLTSGVPRLLNDVTKVRESSL